MKPILSAWIVMVISALVAPTEVAQPPSAGYLGASPPGAGAPQEIDLLLDAIAEAESNDDPSATGDGGMAVSMYQIHPAYWADGRRFLGVQWSYAQARDPAKARAVVRAYLLHYGRGCSLLEMARIHNGGPNGCSKPNTLEYARRIAALLNCPSADS
jgi:hypothetical protein